MGAAGREAPAAPLPAAPRSATVPDLPRALDLRFLGAEHVLATGLIETPDGGVLLVDPGPSTALEALDKGLAGAGYGWKDVRALLLTHIHLDHAGATGTLVREHGMPVYVHAVGARHLARPEKLVASATRLYGDLMGPLWGAFEAVPEDHIRPLDGGEVLEIGGRVLDVAYTPGHAVHHVSYFDRRSGTAFVGDTAGMACPPSGRVLPVTPPPDIDLAAFETSFQTIAAWQPERLFRTHFGLSETPAADLAACRQALREWAEQVETDLRTEANTARASARFSDAVLGRLKADIGEAAAAPYRAFLYPDASWLGLARALRRPS